MPELDAFHLARFQFAFTVSFHILFPAITIGLASYLVVLEGMWLRTHNNLWRSLYNFWLKIFAVNFGMGVVSGLVMGLPVRHKLERIFPVCRQYYRPTAALRSAHRLLPGGGFSGRDAVWLEQSFSSAAFFHHLHGGTGNADVHFLDPRVKQLDADARKVSALKTVT